MKQPFHFYFEFEHERVLWLGLIVFFFFYQEYEPVQKYIKIIQKKGAFELPGFQNFGELQKKMSGAVSWSPISNLCMAQCSGLPVSSTPPVISGLSKTDQIIHIWKAKYNTLLIHFEHSDLKFKHIGTLKTDLSLWKQIWYGLLWPTS